MDSDSIFVDIRTDVSQAERARQKLAQIAAEVADLKAAFDGGNVSLSNYTQQMDRLERAAARAQKAFERFDGAGLRRASAKFQIGLGAANIVQDVAAAGPAAGINNILGLAGSNQVRSLAGEFVAAAGGAKLLLGTLGTIGAVAGAAFLTVNTGLKSNKLEWSDLGQVIDGMTGGVAGKAAGDIGIALTGIWDTVKGYVGSIAEATIGWNSAAEAVRLHKNEIERSTTALMDYQAARKQIDKVKSDGQVEDEKAGGLFGRAAANLDAKGLPGLLDRVAIDQARRSGDPKQVFEVERLALGKDGTPEKDDRGNATGRTEKVKMTRAGLMRESIGADLGKALDGDYGAMDRFRNLVGAAGYGPEALGSLDSAMLGHDPKEEAKDAERARRDSERRARELARPLQDRFNRLSIEGGDKAPDRAGVVRQLVKGGSTADEAEAAADAVLKELRDGLADAIRKRAGEKGLDAAGAGASILAEHREKESEKAATEDRRRRRDAVDAAEKRTAGTNLDGRVDNALLRAALASGGAPGVASAQVSARLEAELKARGMDAEGARTAAGEIVAKHAADLGDKAHGGAMEPKKLDAPDRIAGADFARSVESKGAADAEKLVQNTAGMLEKLSEMLRIAQGGARLR